jgi:hypothetical protein
MYAYFVDKAVKPNFETYLEQFQALIYIYIGLLIFYCLMKVSVKMEEIASFIFVTSF